jgi:GntR family transcriptional regulator, transcriptional repressor for pyruvate dehydrogenase complex
MQLPVTAIKPEPASERVVSQLLAMVTAGTLKPGDRLPGERDMAEMFNVSRPTVREAMRAMAVLGVLKARQGSGIFVSALEATEILGPLSFFLTLQNVQVDQLYEARRLIEGEIASLAARNATVGDIAELQQLIAEQQQRIGDPRSYRELDGSFHRKLAKIAGNPFLARASESLGVLGLEFRKIASETPAVLEISIRDHYVIVDSIAAGDMDGARIGMQAHMMNVLRSTKAAAALILAGNDRNS